MEVTPSQLIELLREGTAPLKARAAIARGILPLPPAALLESLDILADDPDAAVQAEAAASLERLPEQVVRGVAGAPGTSPALLGRLARRFSAREGVALDIARNAASEDATVAALAALPFASVLEVIGRNQARLERCPEIVAALLANAATPLGVVQLWQEHEQRRAAAGDAMAVAALEEEAAQPAAVFDALLIDEDEDAVGGAGAKAPGAASAAVGAAGEGGEALSAKQLSIYAMLKKMAMGQKVALAVKGNREVRNILIRENNRMLCLKVLENPRISEGDIEAYAKSTNISVDVLRGIANKKEWCKVYPIVKGLVCNPRTPIGISLDFIKRLNKRDLEQLTKNRNVPETLRTTARRLFVLKRDSNQ